MNSRAAPDRMRGSPRASSPSTTENPQEDEDAAQRDKTENAKLNLKKAYGEMEERVRERTSRSIESEAQECLHSDRAMPQFYSSTSNVRTCQGRKNRRQRPSSMRYSANLSSVTVTSHRRQPGGRPLRSTSTVWP
jgi:hypothetical protein